jgi:hypothetical protein
VGECFVLSRQTIGFRKQLRLDRFTVCLTASVAPARPTTPSMEGRRCEDW